MTKNLLTIDGQTFDPSAEHFGFKICYTIADMNELAKLEAFTNLRNANFCFSNLDDVGLRHVAKVISIEGLDLQDTRITNEGLSVLENLPNLKRLRLKENTQLTNECVCHLVKLRNLLDLQIHDTSIDQDGANALVSIESLTDLLIDVHRGNYSFEGLRELSLRMPRCTILAKGNGAFLQGKFSGKWDGREFNEIPYY